MDMSLTTQQDENVVNAIHEIKEDNLQEEKNDRKKRLKKEQNKRHYQKYEGKLVLMWKQQTPQEQFDILWGLAKEILNEGETTNGK